MSVFALSSGFQPEDSGDFSRSIRESVPGYAKMYYNLHAYSTKMVTLANKLYELLLWVPAHNVIFERDHWCRFLDTLYRVDSLLVVEAGGNFIR